MSRARDLADLTKYLTIDRTADRITVESEATDVSVVSSNTTATVNDTVYVSTATNTITLPASPKEGDSVNVIVGDFEDTTLARNGSRIMGLEEDLIIDSANIGLELVYTDATNGWRIL